LKEIRKVMKMWISIACLSLTMCICSVVSLVVFIVIFPKTHPWQGYEYIQTQEPLVLNTINNTPLLVWHNTTTLDIPGASTCTPETGIKFCFRVGVILEKISKGTDIRTFAVMQLDCSGVANTDTFPTRSIEILADCLPLLRFTASQDIPPEYRTLCAECLGPKHTTHMPYEAVVVDSINGNHITWISGIVVLSILSGALLATGIIILWCNSDDLKKHCKCRRWSKKEAKENDVNEELYLLK